MMHIINRQEIHDRPLVIQKNAIRRKGDTLQVGLII